MCSVFGNLFTIDASALPATVNDTYINVCGANCPYVEYLDMLQLLTAAFCNASCVANEVNWAASELLQPANASACNLDCQQRHDGFMSQSQLANSPPEAISMQHRKLQNVCYPGCEEIQSCDLYPCPMPTPEQLEEDETCYQNIAKCDDCPQPAAEHPEVGCWYGVYADDSGSPDSIFCTNCADDANMNAAANAASNPSGNSGSGPSVGQVVTVALQVLVALG